MKPALEAAMGLELGVFEGRFEPGAWPCGFRLGLGQILANKTAEKSAHLTFDVTKPSKIALGSQKIAVHTQCQHILAPLRLFWSKNARRFGKDEAERHHWGEAVL